MTLYTAHHLMLSRYNDEDRFTRSVYTSGLYVQVVSTGLKSLDLQQSLLAKTRKSDRQRRNRSYSIYQH